MAACQFNMCKARSSGTPKAGIRMSTSLATLLLVDDDSDSVEAFQALLETVGYTVIPAHSVRDALDVLDAHPEIGVVISDIRMPDVDGLDLVRVLRHRFPGLPCILVSGAVLTDDDVIPRETAVIMSKPVDIHHLQRAIEQALKNRRRGTPPRTQSRPPGG